MARRPLRSRSLRGGCAGLDLGQDGLLTLLRVEWLVAPELFEKLRDGALRLELLEAGGRSEGAERGVFADLFDEERWLCLERRLGQGDDGGLQAVEQQAGAARV